MKPTVLSLLSLFALATLGSCNTKANQHTQDSVSGDYKLFVLNEVTRLGNTDIVINPNPDTLKKYIPEGVYPSAINAFLVQMNDSNFLFDTGLGIKLIKNLDSLGVKPENVHKIFITHCHGDHIGGLLKDGKPVFPNAKLYLNRIEHDYWAQQKNELFLAVIEAYQNRLQLFDLEQNTKQLTAGIQAIAAYGHTPGHTMYLVENKEDKTLIWGDIMHVLPLQLLHPEYSVTYDVNPEEAAQTRSEVMNYVRSNKLRVAGMHVPKPYIIDIFSAK